ncbi:MAG TPA: hypothetical protein VKE92_08730 [Anaerolineales bacterium]|nr:hypothetical protein [Anaerolineales bacterium]
MTTELKLLAVFAHPDDEAMGWAVRVRNILPRASRHTSFALHTGEEKPLESEIIRRHYGGRIEIIGNLSSP